MTNELEIDYEKKFQEDLEKATALSLETLALDQYRRSKLQYSHSDVAVSSSSINYRQQLHQLQQQQQKQQQQQRLYNDDNYNSRFFNQRSSFDSFRSSPLPSLSSVGSRQDVFPSTNSALPTPPPPPRRYSETHVVSSGSNRRSPNETTTTSSDNVDLISFTSPTSDKKDRQSVNFDNLLEELQRLNSQTHSSQQQQQQQANNLTMYGSTPSLVSSSNLQLVPYAGNQQQQGQKTALTSEQLNQLYNMQRLQPQMPYHYQQHATIYNKPYFSTSSSTASSSSSSSLIQPATSATQFNYPPQAPAYGFQMHLFPTQNAITAFNQMAVLPQQQSPSSSASFHGGINRQSSQSSNTSNESSIIPQSVPHGQIPKSSSNIDSLCKMALPSSKTSISSVSSEDNRNFRRNKKTPTTNENDDLIDLGQEDNSRVSVLEAFDPLLIKEWEDADKNCDNLSDCTTSYYTEYDPFDYLYSCGTQYSDPVYDAVNKTDRTPITPNAPSIGWNLTALTMSQTSMFPTITQDEQQQPPPLPPRNNNTTANKSDIHRSSATTSNHYKHSTTTMQTTSRLYENVIDRKTHDPELMEFYKMIKELRSKYKYDDELTNIGHVIASEFTNNNHLCEDKSIKILVYPSTEILKENQISYNNDKQITQIQGYGTPVIFTCDISTTVEHVIMHVYCALEGKIIGSASDFVLKPIGITEWLSTSSKLNQLECVHDCIKLERDVQFGLCLKTDLNMKVYARTAQDDARDMDLKPEDILPNEHESTITFNNMMILIETLETEIDKLEMAANDVKKSSHTTILSCSGVVQAIKAICALLGSIDTLDISNNVNELKKFCSSISQINYSNNMDFDVINNDTIKYNNPNIISEHGDYAEIKLKPKTILDIIQIKCNQLRDSIQKLIQTYANAFRVDFCVKDCMDYIKTEPISITYVLEPIIVNISCLHRPPPNWKYDDYMIGAQIYHGTRFIGEPIVIQYSSDTASSGLFPRLKFDTWITFDKSPLICSLPRESRLIFVLYGCTIEPTTDTNAGGVNNSTITTSTVNSNNSGNSGNNEQMTNDSIIERKQINTELGWAAIQLFDFQRHMINGTHLLSLWPPTTDKFLGPAPAKGCHPHPDYCPVLSIEIPDYGGNIIFPEPIENPLCAPRYDFNSLDHNLQEELLDTAEQGYIMSLDKREVFWEKRHYLQSFPHALPKVLHSAHSWDYDSLRDLYSLLKSWTPLSPLQALELLLPRYPDIEVRSKAVEWISKMSNDQLTDYLPQLLQSLKHDTYEVSSMAKFLLSKCLESPRIAHHLYWLLVHSLPGDAPQNSIDGSYSGGGGGVNVGGGINATAINSGSNSNSSQYDEMLITQARYHRRNKMLLRSLLAVCGEKLLSRFLKQNMMCKTLADTAQAVKRSKESLRQQTLIHGMEMVNQILVETSTSLPLGPGYEVYGISLRGCSYFNSYTLPLKIAFYGPDHGILPAIFKYGDDLQQDMLTIQLVRIMDKLWLAEGLDLKIVTFNCVPTGHKKGMIELVSDAETLRKIQVEYGLTGSFKDRPIAEWLAKKNPSQLEYQRAVDNFTCSCAGYSVATYILGICDRHNDNIMLKTSGHLFHIDFGKFLGDAQMFGNFKRDRTPFVLTSDMAYVINGGDKPSTKFHHFVDLCCRAFNIVRNHGDLLLHMLALMATAGIPGVTSDAITYVRRALLPSQSNPEAAATFAKMIQYSLKNWFTQFNFFLHNLAQLRFSNDDGNGELLSFVPRTYTMQQDGRLKSVTVHGYQKRYDLEKYYTYILKVTRQSQPDPAYLFRSYKEFQEFHQKLCLHFPLAKLHSLPSGSGLGRSNVKTVAERRLPEIQKFLITLFNSADEIAHSDLVYTFFHPLLRDQQEADIHVSKVKEIKTKHKTENVSGEIKLSLQYRRGTLTVMIHHVRGLPLLTGGQEPNTYVKCYLKPDTMKSTKRKTKVVRKTCVPSFMETLEYRMPLECIQNRILQVTVWSHDTLQENELLGGFELLLSQYDLREELCQWFRLGYLPRS